ncbi:MAG: hypothetical protein AAFP00_16230, partial [Bacteroidota bacterium]
MKKTICLVLLLSSIGTYAQDNLVPNPSFEELIRCPIRATPELYIDDVRDWGFLRRVGIILPVMFHDCLGEVGKERQMFRFGPQNPRTGEGMGVLHTDLPQYGSYIYTQLTAPLEKDSLYLVSYYVNKTDSFDFVCSNCVDAYLFEDASILTDTVNIVASPVLVD